MSDRFYSPRILFGEGKLAAVGIEAKALGCRTAYIVSGKSAADYVNVINKVLRAEGISYSNFADARSEPSLDALRCCLQNYYEQDIVIGIGGGSALDTAKAVALLAPNLKPGTDIADYAGISNPRIRGRRLKLLLCPTTAGTGSEVTNAAVFKNKEGVSVFYHKNLFADLALVDPEPSYSMPKTVAANSGMDALGHAIEAYLSVNANPMSEALSLAALELIGKNLEYSIDQADKGARAKMAYAATFAGLALANAGTEERGCPIAGAGLGHSLALPLGKRGVPHGRAVALTMEAALGYNMASCKKKVCDIATALGGWPEPAPERAVQLVAELRDGLELTGRLHDLGIAEADIPVLAKEALNPRLLPNNPWPVSQVEAEQLYRQLL